MAAKNPVHALLAVETDLKNVSSKIMNEAASTFSKKGEHFDGINKRYISEDDSAVGTNNTEIKEVVTTLLRDGFILVDTNNQFRIDINGTKIIDQNTGFYTVILR